MSKRIGGPTFPAEDKNSVGTPPKIADMLADALPPKTHFWEPCAGANMLRNRLEERGHICVEAWDVQPRGPDILKRDMCTVIEAEIAQWPRGTMLITNIPFAWKHARPIMDRIITLPIPSWILHPCDWFSHQRFEPYSRYIHHIRRIGRAKWVADSKHSNGTEAYVWTQFRQEETSVFLT